MNKRQLKKKSKQVIRKIKKLNVNKDDIITLEFGERRLTCLEQRKIFEWCKDVLKDNTLIALPPKCILNKISKENLKIYIDNLNNVLEDKED